MKDMIAVQPNGVRTRDPREAVIELMIAPGWEKDVDDALEGLRRGIPLEIL